MRGRIAGIGGFRGLARVLLVLGAAVGCSTGGAEHSEPLAVARAELGIDASCTNIAGRSWCASEIGSAGGAAGAASYVLGTDGTPVFTTQSVGFGLQLAEIEDPDHPGDDGVHFVYTSVTGDIELVVRLTSAVVTTPPPLVNPGITAGVMIRDNLGAQSRMGAGQYAVGNNGNFCTDTSTHDISQFRVTQRVDLPPGGHPSEGVGGGFDLSSRTYFPVWLRLQRVGQNYSISHSRDGFTWVPMGGGEYKPTAGLVGFFVGGKWNQNQFLTTQAVFDQVYVGPPRLNHATSWIGSSYAEASTDNVTRETDGFYVAPDGKSLKYASTPSEVGHNFEKIDASGAPIKLAPSNNYGFMGATQGSIAGDGTHVYLPGKCGAGAYYVERRAFSTLATSTDDHCATSAPPPGSDKLSFNTALPLGEVTGLATGLPPSGSSESALIYVSDRTNGRVRVVSADTLQETGDVITIDRPGPLAVDHRGRVWIVQSAITYPDPYTFRAGAWNFAVAPRYTADDIFVNPPATTTCPVVPPALSVQCSSPPIFTSVIKCRQRNGALCNKVGAAGTIADITTFVNPTALAIGPNPTDPHTANPTTDKLYVAENGPNQNVRICTTLDTTPSCSGSLGAAGGVFQGATPGLVTSGTTPRFFSLVGVGVDSAGNTFVASSAPRVEIAKFNPSGVRQWTYQGLLQEPGTFDPGTDGQDFYTLSRHLAIDPTKHTPGSEWSSKGVTYNPFGTYPDAERFTAPGPPVTRVRRIGGVPFLFVLGPEGSRIRIYRFNGEVAIPCASISRPATNDKIVVWTDGTGGGSLNGTPETAELQTLTETGGFIFEVDADGHIWVEFQGPQSDGNTFWELTPALTGGVPRYDLGTRQGFGMPSSPGFVSMPWLRYDTTTGAMFLAGGTPLTVSESTNCHPTDKCPCGAPRPTLVRYDNWHSVSNPAPTWVNNLPDPRYTQTQPDDFTHRISDPLCGCSDWGYLSFDQAGSYVFMAERQSQIHVINASTGVEVTRLSPGPETSGWDGNWSDTFGLMQAFRRSTGEYFITTGDSGVSTRSILYRWTPPTQSFSPRDLGPVVWFVASSADVVSDANGAVVTWVDRGADALNLGNSFVQGRPTYSPTGWNGTKPTVTFNGGQLLRNDHFSGLPAGDDKPFTMLAVVQSTLQPTDPAGCIGALSTLNFTGDDIRLIIGPSGSNELLGTMRGNPYDSRSFLTGPVVSSARHVVALRFTPGAQDVFTLTVDATSVSSPGLASLGPVSPDVLLMGASNLNPNSLFKGSISEFLIVPRAITDTELASYRTYAQTQWGGL